jgi:hypothetical protein
MDRRWLIGGGVYMAVVAVVAALVFGRSEHELFVALLVLTLPSGIFVNAALYGGLGLVLAVFNIDVINPPSPIAGLAALVGVLAYCLAAACNVAFFYALWSASRGCRERFRSRFANA